MISRSANILVVDDFEVMRNLLVTQLRALGLESVQTATNGKNALRILHEQPIELIISDWNMPIMSGLDLLKAVRTDEHLRHLPFLMVTATTERDDIDCAIQNGVSSLLAKPYTAKQLEARIEKVLRTRPVVRTRDQPAVETRDEPPPSSAEQPPTLLIVDDSPDNLRLLAHLFRDEFRVRLASSGERALSMLASGELPDVILLDIMMPGLDGFEVAAAIRDHPATSDIPVIFVTALADDGARDKGLALGAVDFVTKPINPDVLLPQVRNFMRHIELRKQLQRRCDDMLALARIRDDVNAITRHDLKAPVAAIIGLAHRLEQDGLLNRQQLEGISQIEKTALQVIDMVNLSVELYRIESGKFEMQPSPVELGPLLRSVVEAARSTFRDEHLVIAVDVDAPTGTEFSAALGDPLLCYSIFQNLVKNACEAAPPSTRVTVTLREEDFLRVEIENKGSVPRSIRSNFFEKYSTSGKMRGTGLGTYSAKLLTEAQGGTIDMQTSDSANRTLVIVTLPKDFRR